jgi:inner membrane protein
MNTPVKLSIIDRYASLLKMIAIGILVLLFLIPTNMIQNLIQERENNQNDVINQVANSWGDKQYIGGPILSVPYLAKVEDDNRRFKMVKMYLHIMPESLKINGNLKSTPLKRSIYEVAVYKGDLDISGDFRIDPYELDQMNAADLLWNEAVLWMEISDLRGVKDELKINWNNTSLFFRPGLKTRSLAESGVSVPIKMEMIDNISTFKFSMKMKLNGSQTIQFYPVGKTTEVKMASDWSSPNFNGAFSPDNRDILKEKKGFTADWKILHLNRNFPQVFKESEHQYGDYAFGVELHQTVDQYQKSMRSVKYAAMFITLTFLVFFFTEIINQKAIHPIQYILIGLALVVFFTLLISMAEHIGFNASYMLAACAVVSLITFYTHAVLKSLKLTAIMATVLIVLYGFIYTIIQLEDFALLFGSIGLFLFLATMMIASRKIDWYQIVKKEDE